MLSEGLVAGAGVIGYHLVRRQGITNLDFLSIGFAALTAVLYFGFDNKTIIENLDVAIYTLLVALLTLSLIRRRPWTAQFAKRVIPPELWGRPAFHTVNMRITALWAPAFVVCDLLALLASGPARRYAPIALLIITATLVPRIARWYRARLLVLTATEPGHLPANTQVDTLMRPTSVDASNLLRPCNSGRRPHSARPDPVIPFAPAFAG